MPRRQWTQRLVLVKRVRGTLHHRLRLGLGWLGYTIATGYMAGSNRRCGAT